MVFKGCYVLVRREYPSRVWVNTRMTIRTSCRNFVKDKEGHVCIWSICVHECLCECVCVLGKRSILLLAPYPLIARFVYDHRYFYCIFSRFFMVVAAVWLDDWLFECCLLFTTPEVWRLNENISFFFFEWKLDFGFTYIWIAWAQATKKAWITESLLI